MKEKDNKTSKYKEIQEKINKYQKKIEYYNNSKIEENE